MKKHNKKELFKNQTIITAILVIAVVITTFGGSYAWFNSQIMKDEYNVFKEEDFELSYVANDSGYGDILSLVGQEPMSDSEANNLKPYRFNVTNVGSKEKYFKLKIDLDQSIIEEDSCVKNLLATSYIKFKMDNQQPQMLGNFAAKDYQIYLSPESVMPGSSEIHELRIWIDENAPQSIKNKHFHATVAVESVDVNKTYATYTVGQAVTLLNGDKYHVLENSSSDNSKVKLISDYNILSTGKQDINCSISKQIKEKISKEEQTLYCSTMNYKEASTVLFGNYLKNLQETLLKYNNRVDNIEVKLPEAGEITKVLGININSETALTDLTSDLLWLTNLNYWTMTNPDNDATYNYTLSVDKSNLSIEPYPQKSEYFGLRPVIVIEKDNIVK